MQRKKEIAKRKADRRDINRQIYYFEEEKRKDSTCRFMTSTSTTNFSKYVGRDEDSYRDPLRNGLDAAIFLSAVFYFL